MSDGGSLGAGPRQPVSRINFNTEFGDVLRGIGLVLHGLPQMDGRMHRVPVVGGKRGQRDGAYVGHSDGSPAGYAKNWKTGQETYWRSSSTPNQNPAAAARQRREIEAKAAKKAADTAARHDRAARVAAARWESAKGNPADHAYIRQKRIRADGLRVDGSGILLVPLRDSCVNKE